MNKDVLFAQEKQISLELQDNINNRIDEIVELYKNNEQVIIRLTFESITLLTSINEELGLNNRGILKRILGEFIKIPSSVHNYSSEEKGIAQFVAKMILKILAEQSLLTFDLIEAVKVRLHTLTRNSEEQMDTPHKEIINYLNYQQSQIIQLERRLERAECRTDILTWATSVGYLQLGSQQYNELDEVSKLICMARDFFEITKGEWKSPELLILKKTMDDLGLDSNQPINYAEVIEAVAYNPILQEKLFEDTALSKYEVPNYLLGFTLLQKMDALQVNEGDVVNAISEIVQENNVDVDRKTIINQLAKNYLRKTTLFNLNVEVSSFSVLVDLLFNLKNIKVVKHSAIPLIGGTIYDEQEDLEFKKGEDLFIKGKLAEALPILKKAAKGGNPRAMYYLGEYPKINEAFGIIKEEGEVWTKKGAILGNAFAMLNLTYISERLDVEYIEMIYPQILELAEAGDVVALNELYIWGLCLNKFCLESILKSAEKGYWRANEYLFRLYRNGNAKLGVAADKTKAIEYANRAYEGGYVEILLELGNFYKDIEQPNKAIEILTQYYNLGGLNKGQAANQIGVLEEKVEKKLVWYKRAADLDDYWGIRNYALYLLGENDTIAIEYYKKLLQFSDTDLDKIYKNIGIAYFNLEKLEDAFDNLLKAAECGDIDAMEIVSVLYLKGQGTSLDVKESFYWTMMAAKNGNKNAASRLNDYIVVDK